jgi:hypothetical protein
LYLNLPKTTTSYFWDKKPTHWAKISAKNHHIRPNFYQFFAQYGAFLSQKREVVGFGKFEYRSGGFMLLTPNTHNHFQYALAWDQG